MSTAAAAALLATSLRLVASHAYPDGAPPGFSGGFKEESCHGCHFLAGEPNTPPGRVTIDGIPERYTPGQRYILTIALTRAGMKRAGFQLAARVKDTGAQGGALAPAPADKDRVKIDSQGGVQYANQTREGSASGDGETARWTVEWVAPAGGGPVIFNVSANAADGNGSADGDFVYTAIGEAAPPQPDH